MVPKLRLKTHSKKAERLKAENQYFLYGTLKRRILVEAYCPTIVKLVSLAPCCKAPGEMSDQVDILADLAEW
jgi:hypothetical protein